MSPRGCSGPMDPLLLADYWIGELPESEAALIEEHLLGCDVCSTELAAIQSIGSGIQTLVRGGAVAMVISHEFLERRRAEGLRVREYAVPAGSSVQCTVTAQDDLLIGRLQADFSDLRRLDVLQLHADGTEVLRFEDVPFCAGRGEIIVSQPVPFIRTLPSHTEIIRIVAIQEGSEQIVGEYTFHHTASA